MEVLSVILDYLPFIITAVILIGGLIALILGQKKSAKEWLLFAVVEAEKAFGSGTGEIKLRAVYDAFTTHFGLLAKFVSFETFSRWVNLALQEMKKLIVTNQKTAEYILPTNNVVKGEDNV